MADFSQYDRPFHPSHLVPHKDFKAKPLESKIVGVTFNVNSDMVRMGVVKKENIGIPDYQRDEIKKNVKDMTKNGYDADVAGAVNLVEREYVDPKTSKVTYHLEIPDGRHRGEVAPGDEVLAIITPAEDQTTGAKMFLKGNAVSSRTTAEQHYFAALHAQDPDVRWVHGFLQDEFGLEAVKATTKSKAEGRFLKGDVFFEIYRKIQKFTKEEFIQERKQDGEKFLVYKKPKDEIEEIIKSRFGNYCRTVFEWLGIKTFLGKVDVKGLLHGMYRFLTGEVGNVGNMLDNCDLMVPPALKKGKFAKNGKGACRQIDPIKDYKQAKELCLKEFAHEFHGNPRGMWAMFIYSMYKCGIRR